MSALCSLGNPLAAVMDPGHPLLATVLLCLASAGTMAAILAYNITQVSMRQRVCPRPLLGRMNASIRFVVWGIMPISALIGGWLGSHLGVAATMTLGALGALMGIIPVRHLGSHVPRDLNSRLPMPTRA